MDYEQKANDLTDKWIRAFRDLRDETIGFFEDLDNSKIEDSKKVELVVKMTSDLSKLQEILRYGY